MGRNTFEKVLSFDVEWSNRGVFSLTFAKRIMQW
jgi:hypothetical protein